MSVPRRHLSAWSLITATCLALPVGGVFAGPATGPESAEGSEEASEVQELFRMCCWAEGRGGFQYCTDYGACTAGPEATCTGRGAAEGLVLDCASKTTRATGAGFFLLALR